MEPAEASSILRDMADSLEANTAQFNYEITMVGMNASPVISGGHVDTVVGFQAGGGPGAGGSFVVNQTIGPVEVRQMQGAAGEHFNAVIAALRDLADLSGEPDVEPGRLKAALEHLRSIAAPQVIYGVAASVLASRLI